MKTEEILKRAEEYRQVREALGVYSVELAGPGLGSEAGALRSRPRDPERPADAPLAEGVGRREDQRKEGTCGSDPTFPRPDPG